MIELNLTPESLQTEYEAYKAKTIQTQKLLTHLNYLKQYPIPPKQAPFMNRMFHEQSKKYAQQIHYLSQLKQHLTENATVK